MSSSSNDLRIILKSYPAPHDALNHLTQIGVLIQEEATCSPSVIGFTVSRSYRTVVDSQSALIESHGEGVSKAEARGQCVKATIARLRILLGLDPSDLSLPIITHDTTPTIRPVLESPIQDLPPCSPVQRIPPELILARIVRAMTRFPMPHAALNYMVQNNEIARFEMKLVEQTAGVFAATQLYDVAYWGLSTDSFVAQGVGMGKSNARASCYGDAVSRLCDLAGYPHSVENGSSSGSSSPPFSATTLSTAPTSPPISEAPLSPADSVSFSESLNSGAMEKSPLTLSTKQIRSLEQAKEHVLIFERMMDCIEGVFDEQPTLLLAIDVEANEKPDPTGKHEVLEVGLVREKLGEHRTARNVVVEQRQHVRNKNAVNNPESFAYGNPEYVPEPHIWGIVQQNIDEMKVGSNRFVVVHTFVNDCKWLVGEGINLDGLSVCDIAQVQRYWEGAMQNKGLVGTAQEHGVWNGAQPHCGANDAWTTMDVLIAMITARRPWLADAFLDHTLTTVGGNGCLPYEQGFTSLL